VGPDQAKRKEGLTHRKRVPNETQMGKSKNVSPWLGFAKEEKGILKKTKNDRELKRKTSLRKKVRSWEGGEGGCLQTFPCYGQNDWRHRGNIKRDRREKKRKENPG